MSDVALRPQLQEIVDEFALSPPKMRLELLLGFASDLPPLPEELQGHPERMERVAECQTPFFVQVRREGDGIRLFFEAPPEAPTTRGYAGVLAAGLDGATAEEILATPPDFFTGMKLAEVVSPLRLRGMSAILARIKRMVAQEATGA